MKTECRLFGVIAAFLLRRHVRLRVLDQRRDWAASTGSAPSRWSLSFLLTAMCGGFFWFVSRRIDPRPEDRPDARDRRRRRRARLLQPGQLLAVRARAVRHDRRARPGVLAALADGDRAGRRHPRRVRPAVRVLHRHPPHRRALIRPVSRRPVRRAACRSCPAVGPCVPCPGSRWSGPSRPPRTAPRQRPRRRGRCQGPARGRPPLHAAVARCVVDLRSPTCGLGAWRPGRR